jgi:FKBP-type peptidyl-prolyl cis-trans isomerase
MNTLRQTAVALAIAGAAALALADATTRPAQESNTPATQPAVAGAASEGPRMTTPSGVTCVIVQSSEGVAQAGDRVRVHYAGRLESNGKEFDNSYKRGEPIEFPLGAGRVIKGWDEGVTGMKIGEKRQLIIPPNLAYGERGTPGGEIPPNSTLVFDVELVGIVRQ